MSADHLALLVRQQEPLENQLSLIMKIRKLLDLLNTANFIILGFVLLYRNTREYYVSLRNTLIAMMAGRNIAGY